MKKREDWLVEWDQVPTWAKAIFAVVLSFTILAGAALTIDLLQMPATTTETRETRPSLPSVQDARHRTVWR